MPKVVPLFPLNAGMPAADSFDAFWEKYPRRVGKGAARKAWSKAIVNGADPRAILDACARLPAEYAGRELRYIPHPATWLNREGWDDEPGAANGTSCLPDPRTAARVAALQIEEPPPPGIEERRRVGALLGELRRKLAAD